MRRALLLLLALSTAVPPPAAAQPWAAEAQRAAGRQALAAAAAGRLIEADALAAAADPLAAKVVRWMRVQARGNGLPAAEIVGWLEANPDWPFPEAVARRAEEALAGDADDALALRHFARFPPRTLEGAQRLADALARAGRGPEAAVALRRAWADGAAAEGESDSFADRNAATLTAEDHWRRFGRLMWEGQTGAAGRLQARLDPARRGVAEAWLALRAEREAPAAGEIGPLFETARNHRRRDRDAEAAAAWAAAEPLQRDLPPEAARAIWAERQVLARKLLRLGDPAAAYRVAANHGQAEPGEPRQEAEFLAGFIALRRLNDAAGAQRHFARLGEGSTSVITRARSGYWEGLALQALGRAAEARARFEAASALPVALYGQLAALALGDGPAELHARIRAVPSASPGGEAAHLFAARELPKVVLTLADLGQHERARAFLLRLEALAPNAGDRWLAARLAGFIGRPDQAVWVARRAGTDGVILLEDGWPTPFPAPSGTVEAALVHAITRQESNFDTNAVSSANARGLMQLLPATAQEVARRLGVRHTMPMLTADPAHNIRLGAAFLGELLSRFEGAVPLAAAGYNAGPRRVDEWLSTYGDPRRPDGPDIRDWIEQIPFSETRNYVQRVVENMVVYRSRDPAAAALPHPLAGMMR